MIVAFLGLALASPGKAGSFYGIQGNPLTEAGWTQSRFVPINGHFYRLRQPDGRFRVFKVDDEDADLLVGDSPWLGQRMGNQTLIRTNPEAKIAGETGFLFVDGVLRKMLLNGREYNSKYAASQSRSAALPSLWPQQGKRRIADQSPDIWSRAHRLRLWFANPNFAGLLFAELFLASFLLIFAPRLWLRIPGVLFALSSFVGLILTSSRGGLLALLMGGAVLLIFKGRRIWSNRRVFISAVVIGLLAVASLFVFQKSGRFTRNLLRDASQETSRLEVWSKTPKMMYDAPGGWGYGQSAQAYIDWYQGEKPCLLKNLISGHLTFLVESSWLVRGLYLMFWCWALLGSFLLAWQKRSPVPCAILVAFACGASFNPVLGVWELLLIPAAACAYCAVQMRHLRARTVAILLASSCALALATCAVLWIWGRMDQKALPIHGCSTSVTLNGSDARVWIVEDDYVLHGGYWWMKGREIREWFAAHPQVPAVTVARSVRDIPNDVDCLVLVGEAGRDFLALPQRPKVPRVLFISPPFLWSELEQMRAAGTDVRSCQGALAVPPEKRANLPDWVSLVSGAELYVPDWLDRVQNFVTQTTNGEKQ